MDNKKNIVNDEIFNRGSECLKCLAHPVRLKILYFLENDEKNVSEIIEFLGISQSVTSDHLRILVDKGILDFRKQGRWNYYKLKIPELKTILQCIKRNEFKRR